MGTWRFDIDGQRVRVANGICSEDGEQYDAWTEEQMRSAVLPWDHADTAAAFARKLAEDLLHEGGSPIPADGIRRALAR